MIFLMHGTSLASIITLLDLTGAARVAARGTFAFSESYFLAIGLYMALTGTMVLGVATGGAAVVGAFAAGVGVASGAFLP